MGHPDITLRFTAGKFAEWGDSEGSVPQKSQKSQMTTTAGLQPYFALAQSPQSDNWARVVPCTPSEVVPVTTNNKRVADGYPDILNTHFIAKPAPSASFPISMARLGM